MLVTLRSSLRRRSFPFVLCFAVLLADALLSTIVLLRVKYTEIDWRAYMQEVEGVLSGNYNYSQLRGDTGPLVYPGGFVAIYSILHNLTDSGSNLFAAQLIFVIFYLINLAIVWCIYMKTNDAPVYALLVMTFASYRVHSIFLLRLFNDGIAALFAHAAILLFMHRWWSVGCLIYSLGVAVKMNVILYAPGLLALLLAEFGLVRTIPKLVICATPQLIFGAPFLLTAPVEYIRGAFDLSRVFMYKWTVNWRLIPEWLFLARGFHVSLLICHGVALLALLMFRWRPLLRRRRSSPAVIAHILFTSNLVGVIFARSLHYQFYVWYFYSIPALLYTSRWTGKFTPDFLIKLIVPLLLEFAWNTYPSTVISSSILHIAHAFLLIGIIFSTFNYIKSAE